MSTGEFFLFLFLFCAGSWQLAISFRLPRYVRILQNEGYNYPRYERYLTSNPAEARYFIIMIVVVGTFCIISCGASLFLLPDLVSNPLSASTLYLSALLLTLNFAPRNSMQTERTRRSARALRILITAFLLELFPPYLALSQMVQAYAGLTDPRNSPESSIFSFIFVSFITWIAITVGPVNYVLMRYAPMLAVIINWPLDVMLAKIRPVVMNSN